MKILPVLTHRQVRICLAAIEWYEKYGTAPPIKWLAMSVYERHREIIYRDVHTLIEAGVLVRDRRFGIRTLRPAPAYRLPFKDEAGMRPEDKGHMVPVLRHIAAEMAAEQQVAAE